MKTRIAIIIIAVLCVVGILVGFKVYKDHKSKTSAEDNIVLTEVQKITTRDLSAKYPETPREVVKLYNRILKCYFGEEWTEEELKQLAEHAYELMDTDLQKENGTVEDYLASVKEDIEEYKEEGRTISQTDVSDSNDVEQKTKDGEKIAYVNASYFVKVGSKYENTYQEYILRRDDNEKWRILGFHLIDNPNGSKED